MKIYGYNGKCNVSGKNIKAVREKLQLSQEQLAARMQVDEVILTQKAISRIESGERIVTDYELMTFAKVLNTSTNALLQNENHD